jgi:hypothetical protein
MPFPETLPSWRFAPWRTKQERVAASLPDLRTGHWFEPCSRFLLSASSFLNDKAPQSARFKALPRGACLSISHYLCWPAWIEPTSAITARKVDRLQIDDGIKALAFELTFA